MGNVNIQDGEFLPEDPSLPMGYEEEEQYTSIDPSGDDKGCAVKFHYKGHTIVIDEIIYKD